MSIDLDKYLYLTIKVKYQKMPKSLFELSHSWDIKKWMRVYFQGTTQGEHLALRDAALAKQKDLQKFWTLIADREFERLFHRKMFATDYRVSGIGRSEFSNPVKEQLRKIVFSENIYQDIAYAHNLMLPARLRI
jgi:hypothetical protein